MLHMGTLHDLIEAKGKAGTLAFDFNRQVVEAAAAYMADEDAGIGIQAGAKPPCPIAGLLMTKVGRLMASAFA
jgi:hypothetical protein